MKLNNKIVIYGLIVTCSTIAGAQPAPMAGLPAPMLGKPLYSGELPVGVVTVRVIGQSLQDARSSVQVDLLQLTTAGDGIEHTHTQVTGSDGRVRFEGLAAGKSYRATIKVADSNVVTSETFSLPTSSGVRLMLSTTASAPATAIAPPQTPHTETVHPMPADPVHTASANPGQSGAAKIDANKTLPNGNYRILITVGAEKKPAPSVKIAVVQTDKPQTVLTTDAAGSTTYTTHQNTPFELTVEYSGITYRSDRIDPKTHTTGQDITFLVFDRTTQPTHIQFGVGSYMMLQVSEQAVWVRQTISIQNTGQQLYDPGATGLQLPVATAAHNIEVGPSYKEIVTVNKSKNQLTLTRPIPPGRLVVEYLYFVPYTDKALDIIQSMPVRTEPMLAIMTNQSGVELSGPAIKSKRVEHHAGLNAPLYTLSATPAGQPLEFTISNLPVRNRTWTWVTLTIAGVILLWAIGASLKERKQP